VEELEALAAMCLTALVCSVPCTLLLLAYIIISLDQKEMNHHED
jgi:hypothetical protein